MFPTSHQLRRVDTSKLSRTALLYVDSPEPVKLLASLFTGPQYPLLEDPPTPHSLLVLAGPAGVGKTTVLRALLAAQPSQLRLVPVVTSRPPLRREPGSSVVLVPPSADGTGKEVAEGQPGRGPCARDAIATACCISAAALQAASDAGQLLAVCQSWDGHTYGVSKAALEAVWAEGCLPVIEGPLELALALKELSAQAAEEAAAAAASAPPPLAASASRTSTGAPLKSEASRISAAGPPAAGGAKAPEPALVARVAYLAVDLAELDVRLRLQGQREEADVGLCLQAAQVEAATLQRLALDSPAPPPPGSHLDPLHVLARAQHQQQQPAAALAELPQGQLPPLPHPEVLDVVAASYDAVVAFHSVKQLAADSWRRPRAQVAGQLVLEEFDWRASRPGATVQRLRTHMANAGMLELPRGRHVLRINSDSLLLHAVTFMSTTPCTVGEYSQIMPMCDAGLHVSPYEGRYDPVPLGATALMFRYNLAVPEPATISAYLSINGEDMRSVTRLLLVDKATGTAQAIPSNRLHATELAPNAHGSGYCLVALADASSRAVTEEGTFCLTVTSTSSLAGHVVEVPCHRADAFREVYRPNARHVLSRHVITATAACQLAAVAATEPRLPFTMTLQEAGTGQEITWAGSGSYPVRIAASSSVSGGGIVATSGDRAAPPPPGPSTDTGVLGPEGYALIADTSLKAGKYLLTCTLDAAACPAGLQPDPVTGVMPHGTPVAVRLSVHPSADEKACTVVADNALQKYVQGVYDKWNAAPVQLMAPPQPPTGKGAAAKPQGSTKGIATGRAVVAAGLLEKYTSAQQPAAGVAASAAEGGTGAEPGPEGVPRVLKDMSTMVMQPQEHVRVVCAQPGGRVTEQQLEERQASATATAAAEGAARIAGVSKALEASKGERAGFKARQASQFAEWRAARVQAQREASSKREEVMASVKAAAVQAAAAAVPVAVPVAAPAANGTARGAGQAAKR